MIRRPLLVDNRITHDELLRVLHYDLATGVWTWRRTGAVAGSIQVKRKKGWVDRPCWRIKVNGQKYLGSRLAWFYMTGEWPEATVDHEDGDGLNNAWYNLRKATHSQNAQNRVIRVNSTSGYLGVYYNVRSKKWQAEIGVDGYRLRLGYYNTSEEAHRAYLNAKAIVHPFQPIPRAAP